MTAYRHWSRSQPTATRTSHAHGTAHAVGRFTVTRLAHDPIDPAAVAAWLDALPADSDPRGYRYPCVICRPVHGNRPPPDLPAAGRGSHGAAVAIRDRYAEIWTGAPIPAWMLHRPPGRPR